MNELAWNLYLRRLLRKYQKAYRREERLIARYGGSTKLLEAYEDAIYAVKYRIECLKSGKVPV